jgi:hypothetical protein
MCNEFLATRREKTYLCNREGNQSLHVRTNKQNVERLKTESKNEEIIIDVADGHVGPYDGKCTENGGGSEEPAGL